MLPFVGSDPTRFDVAVPQALPIQAHAFNGDVTIEKPTAAVQVDDGTGAVAVTNARAGVDLATERGDLQVTLAPNWRSSSIRLETGNGNISLSVPANFRGHVIVAAPSGRVHNELSPAAMHAKSPFVWLNTGKGDASITISH